jgi:hypothetical protein
MSRINPGALPVAVRQTGIAVLGMTGVAPSTGGKLYVPHYSSGRYDYADPDDSSLIDLDLGGLFQFEETIEIVEIRTFLAAATVLPPTIDGTFSVDIEDRDGTHVTSILPALTNGVGKLFSYYPGLIVLKTQRIIVKTTRVGAVELYIRKGDSN